MNRVVLLSDLHIGGNLSATARGYCMASNFLKAVASVFDPHETGDSLDVIINGDLSFKRGRDSDYATADSLLGILRRSAKTHLVPGNHDSRENLLKWFPDQTGVKNLEFGKCPKIVETGPVVWIILDTLKPGSSMGEVGKGQMEWLKINIDRYHTKKVLVVGHHPPVETRMEDSRELIQTLKDKSYCVKAYISGHLHKWSVSEKDGLRLIGLPAVGYSFSPDHPIGWVDVYIEEDRVKFLMRSLNPNFGINNPAIVPVSLDVW